MRRPISVTVVGWLLIAGTCVFGTLDIVVLLLPARHLVPATGRLPIPFEYFTIGASLVAGLLSGLFILKGANWARLLCLISVPSFFLIKVVDGRTSLSDISDSLVYVALFWVLTRPAASAFFARNTAPRLPSAGSADIVGEGTRGSERS